MENKNLTLLDILKQVALARCDGENIAKLHESAVENKKPFSCTYALNKAMEANKTLQEELWAALGASCDYDIRNIASAIEDFYAEQDGKEAEDE